MRIYYALALLLMATGAVAAPAYTGNVQAATGTFNGNLSAAGTLAVGDGPASNAAVTFSSGTSFEFDWYGSSAVIYALSGGANFGGRALNGTLAAPTTVTDNQTLFAFTGSGYDGATYPGGLSTPVSFTTSSSGTWSTSNHGAYGRLFTTPLGSTTRAERFRVTDAGDFGIGTTAPTAKLDVNGTIKTNSSSTASGFFGDVSATTGSVILGSTSSTSGVTVNSLTFIGVSTFTVSLRGGRALIGNGTVEIDNGAGAARTLSVRVTRGGVAVTNVYQQVVVSGGLCTINVSWATNSSTSGIQTYVMEILSSSATGTQTARDRSLYVVEY